MSTVDGMSSFDVKIPKISYEEVMNGKEPAWPTLTPKHSRLAQHTVTVISQSSARNMERGRAHNETENNLNKKEGNNMPSLTELLQELRELDVSPNEVDIPSRWYRRIINQAEELCEETEENEDD